MNQSSVQDPLLRRIPSQFEVNRMKLRRNVSPIMSFKALLREAQDRLLARRIPMTCRPHELHHRDSSPARLAPSDMFEVHSFPLLITSKQSFLRAQSSQETRCTEARTPTVKSASSDDYPERQYIMQRRSNDQSYAIIRFQ